MGKANIDTADFEHKDFTEARIFAVFKNLIK